MDATSATSGATLSKSKMVNVMASNNENTVNDNRLLRKHKVVHDDSNENEEERDFTDSLKDNAVLLMLSLADHRLTLEVPAY
ncbi:uncharacterized protein IUM83_10095 [Phytophthora cinnamomi]|uniref:uncharacterized protein n=1 Tax=Phytophthora cinnamomi TaxID=4785 RepID=UPI00355ACAE0|nr:hypothetical protein IUM83_10095 [Phytophthora cinnamomi]